MMEKKKNILYAGMGQVQASNGSFCQLPFVSAERCTPFIRDEYCSGLQKDPGWSGLGGRHFKAMHSSTLPPVLFKCLFSICSCAE